MSSSERRVIGTRSKSRDEEHDAEAAVAKENVGNEKADFQPPASSTTPRKRQQSTESKASNRSTLFSPSPYASGRHLYTDSAARMAAMNAKKPDPFPDNWEEAMGTTSNSGSSNTATLGSARNRERRECQPQQQQDSFGGGYSAQPTDSSSREQEQRKMMTWEPRSSDASQQVHRESSSASNNNNYGSLAADLDMAARGSSGDDDFPAVADCLNLGSFAEESPPRSNRYQRSSPHKGASPSSSSHHHHPYHEQQQPYPYRRYPPHGSPQQPPPPPPYPMYPPGGSSTGGPPPPSSYYPPPSPYGYPGAAGPYRYPSYQGADAWMSPAAQQFPDYHAAARGGGTPPRGSPPPKKRRSSDWDNSNTGSSSSSPGEVGTPEKTNTMMRSPFRSPIPTSEQKGSTSKKYKKSPLFGGTPGGGIGWGGSWDTGTPGGTLGAALGDEFSPMGPSFAPFEDELPLQEGNMPFDAKLDLAAGEEPGPPVIRQRPTGQQPAASPFSSFVGDLSPFPPQQQQPMRGSPPVNHDQRDYPARHHPGHPAFHRSPPPDEFPRHPGMPTPSKRSSSVRGPAAPAPGLPVPGHPDRPTHPMASPVMSGSAQRQQPWYGGHVGGPSPGHHFRMELGDGKARKGFDDINSLLRGANGPPPPPQRPSPPSRPRQPSYESSGQPRPASARDLTTPIKAEGGRPLGGAVAVPGSSGRSSSYHGSARKTPVASTAATPRYTPMATKGRSTSSTPGSKTPSSVGKGAPTPTPVRKARRHPCNCKKSKCLKLYCECFASELYCDGCNCNDCHNTTAYEAERQKSMKDTRAKNPNAFKKRITVTSASGGSATTTPAGGHNMGCRCKKSECLKKYCECFQAGVMCASKCKCVDCLNYVGSQALIDKRRKMKDHRGAEMAMRIADEAWKGGKHSAPRGMNPRGMKPSPAVSQRGPPMPPMPPHMMQPSPANRRGHPPPPPHYMGPMMGHPHMGYSPMGAMPPVTPGYGHGKKKQTIPNSSRRAEATGKEPKADPKKKQQQQQGKTPKTVTPRTPGVRLGFDPHSSKKKRKLRPGAKEPTFPYFGDRPEQPKTTALAIFSYLSNDDLFNSTLVCKQWNKLALDDELWQF